MSEYIEITSELNDDETAVTLTTNLTLTQEPAESYTSLEAMAEGSPIAQTLSVIEGLASLTLHPHQIIITRQPFAEWHALIADISAALRDFFL